MKLEVIRHIDGLGRICIPKDFRRSFEITEETEIILEVTDVGIMLKVKNEESED